MAFVIRNWSRQSVALNTGETTVDGAELGGPAIFTYRSDDDNAATIEGANYFADVVFDLSVNDIIFAQGSDAFTARSVLAVDRDAGTITTQSIGLNDAIATANIEDDAVTNAKIADDAVSLENLDDGIAPSHVVKFAGQPTTVGGNAAEAITVTGALVSDLAFVQMVDDGSNDVTIVNAVVTADTLTVTFSADPGNDAVINYQLLRAAS